MAYRPDGPLPTTAWEDAREVPRDVTSPPPSPPDGIAVSPPRREPAPATSGSTVQSGLRLRRVLALAGLLEVIGMSAMGVLASRDEGGGILLLVLVLPSVVVVSGIPFVVYLTELRSAFTSLITGLGLMSATLLMYAAIITSAEPGAYFGFVLAPLANLAIVAFGMLIDFFRLGPR